MNNSITLVFKSNLAINRRGFVAEYETIGLKLLQTNHAIQQWQIIIKYFLSNFLSALTQMYIFILHILHIKDNINGSDLSPTSKLKKNEHNTFIL